MHCLTYPPGFFEVIGDAERKRSKQKKIKTGGESIGSRLFLYYIEKDAVEMAKKAGYYKYESCSISIF